MFCDIKSEYCLDFINLFGIILVTKSEGEIAGTSPSTTLNINIRHWAVLLFSSVDNSRYMSILVMQPGSLDSWRTWVLDVVCALAYQRLFGDIGPKLYLHSPLWILLRWYMRSFCSFWDCISSSFLCNHGSRIFNENSI